VKSLISPPSDTLNTLNTLNTQDEIENCDPASVEQEEPLFDWDAEDSTTKEVVI